MTSWEERMNPQPPAPSLFEHVATLFRVQGASRRPLRAAVYRVATGLELRLEYEDRDDLQRSQLFVIQDDEAIAALADEWHSALILKGFAELPVVRAV